ncbi:UNVERIFIED_CONTAM: hypothetical protein PYX00_000477 [Menopon gallinae]|uniref:Uncharacterized protein n=1 Tax=Menopon gallinae TaxID=328185 RepID=A0AAW2I9F3_9NEOP
MSETHGQLPEGGCPDPERGKTPEKFTDSFVDGRKIEKDNERKIAGGVDDNRWTWKQCKPSGISVNVSVENDGPIESESSKCYVENEKNGGKAKELDTLAVDLRPPRSNIESGYLNKGPKGKNGREDGEAPAVKRKPPGYPEEAGLGKGIKMSSMEKEAMRERLRMTLLKQCSDYLEADGSSRYTRDTFRRVFTDKVDNLIP